MPWLYCCLKAADFKNNTSSFVPLAADRGNDDNNQQDTNRNIRCCGERSEAQWQKPKRKNAITNEASAVPTMEPATSGGRAAQNNCGDDVRSKVGAKGRTLAVPR